MLEIAQRPLSFYCISSQLISCVRKNARRLTTPTSVHDYRMIGILTEFLFVIHSRLYIDASVKLYDNLSFHCWGINFEINQLIILCAGGWRGRRAGTGRTERRGIGSRSGTWFLWLHQQRTAPGSTWIQRASSKQTHILDNLYIYLFNIEIVHEVNNKNTYEWRSEKKKYEKPQK